MEDEFYRDLLGDFDGKLLEIQLDDQDDQDDQDGNPQSLVVDCSAIDVSLAVSKMAKRTNPGRQEHEGGDEAAWLRLMLSSFDVDAILSELNSVESHESGRFDQLASILDVSLVDIDFEPIAAVDPGFPPTPQGFGGYLPSPIPARTPAPVAYHHQLTPWCTTPMLYHHQARRSREQVLPSTTIFLPPVRLSSSSSVTKQCLDQECTQLAIVLDMCHAHADELFEQLQPSAKKTRKRRRVVFSTGAKKKKKKKQQAETAEKKCKTSVKPAKKATKKQQQEQQQQLHHGEQNEHTGEQEEVKVRVHKRPLRSRRISYGEEK